MTTPAADLNHFLAAACEAAAAGAAELESWRSRFGVKEKARADLVTDADHASQAAVKAVLLGRCPGHRFLGEEECVGKTPQEVRPAPGSPPTWVVDPLDGTANYVHDVPAYCVSIGLVVEGSIVVGVISDPRQNELFAAAVGRGAFLNGRPIRVSPTAHLRDALLSTGFPANWAKMRPNLAAWTALSEHAQGLRRTGSTALNMAYVAAGRFDGYWAFDNYPWDLAAGALIVTEAGGTLSTTDGRPFDCFRPDLIATNGKIHTELCAALNTRAGVVAP
ncbi:MAG TPA: inositol monophosphatase family protein [Fimbriiglobus sp.]|jgi:myo-inositol-1(or 4)-monophosphatase